MADGLTEKIASAHRAWQTSLGRCREFEESVNDVLVAYNLYQQAVKEQSMSHTVEILGRSGHVSLTWDPDQPAEVAQARTEIVELIEKGYSFFAAVESSDPDALLAAGKGRLEVSRIADPVRELTPEPTAAAPAEEATPIKTRGKRAVATAPMRGG